MNDMEGQVALVTGGANGIGRAIVRGYVHAGAQVGVLDRDETALAELDAELGKSTRCIPGRVESLTDNRQAVNDTVAAFGNLDVFVGNAGVGAGNHLLVDTPDDKLEAAIDEIYAINVKGYLLGARASLPSLLRTGGCMIFSCSLASYRAVDDGVLYVSTKHADLGIVRQLAWEFAPKIRVNGVAIGVARTQMIGLQSLSQAPIDAVLPGSESVIPMGKIPEPEDYTGTFRYLASRQVSGLVTGECVFADSGFSVRGIGQPAAGHELDPDALELQTS
jgi:NAD(P)-dependent dehydrogenase (short-subunit alcohol dehydrogenase family)